MATIKIYDKGKPWHGKLVYYYRDPPQNYAIKIPVTGEDFDGEPYQSTREIELHLGYIQVNRRGGRVVNVLRYTQEGNFAACED